MNQSPAFCKGYRAFYAGKNCLSNPYDHDTQEFRDWQAGFYSAQEHYVADDPDLRRYA